MARSHRDVEFHVGPASGGETRYFRSFEDATSHAVWLASTLWVKVNIDAVVLSRAGARAIGILEEYDEDPEASVAARIVVSAVYVGRVS